VTIGAGILRAPARALQAAPQSSEIKISARELAEIRLVLKEFNPPATPEEAVLFRQFRNNPVDVKGFIATRKYLRLLGYPKYEPKDPSEAPKIPVDVKYEEYEKFTLNFDEKFRLFQIFLSQKINAMQPQ
jgi:hypothetical protein